MHASSLILADILSSLVQRQSKEENKAGWKQGGEWWLDFNRSCFLSSARCVWQVTSRVLGCQCCCSCVICSAQSSRAVPGAVMEGRWIQRGWTSNSRDRKFDQQNAVISILSESRLQKPDDLNLQGRNKLFKYIRGLNWIRPCIAAPWEQVPPLPARDEHLNSHRDPLLFQLLDLEWELHLLLWY